jgi:hypothetical protein
VHDQAVLLGQLEPLRRQGEEVVVLAHRREVDPALPLELDAQHHDDVGAGDRVFHPVEHLAAELLDPGRHQAGRAADPHLRPHAREQQHVGADDARELEVAEDRDHLTLERAAVEPDRQRVEQRLGRVLVGAVAGVDHRGLEDPRQLVRRAGVAVPDDDEVRLHRLEVAGGVDQRLALLDRRGAGGEVEGVGREPLLRHLEREAGPGRRLEEQVDDRLAAQRRHLLDRALGNLAHLLGGIEEQLDLAGRQRVDADQVLAAQAGGRCDGHQRASRASHTPSSSSVSARRTWTSSVRAEGTARPTKSAAIGSSR